jgi:Flp pilus assembly pilin Flp
MARLRKLIGLWKLLARDTRGVSAIEYAIIIAGVAAFVVLAWTLTGTQLTSTFQSIAGGFEGDVPSAADNADSGGASDNASTDNDSDSDFEES